MALVHDLLDRWKAMEARKAAWKSYWQQLGDIFTPNQADFTNPKQPGEQRGVGIYDGTPRLALRDLSAAIDGLIKSKSSRWFDVTVEDSDLAEDEEVKAWLETVRERMWDAIYDPRARFIQRSGEVDQALCCFGWAPLWVQQNRQRNGLLFKTFHISKVAIDENEDGVIDAMTIEENLTPRQAAAKYKAANKEPSGEIAQCLKHYKSGDEKKFQFVQIVLPNSDYMAGAFGPKGMLFRTALIDVKDEQIIEEAGFHEFPAAVPRWETAPGEIYARSPAMMALPDSQTLQAMAKTLMVGGQRAVDPPIWVANDSVMSPLRSFPGGVTVLDMSDVTGTPMGALPVSTNIPLGREMQQDYRAMVEAAFFKNVMNLPLQGPQMTATEIIQRKEEFIRILGPVFGRLETDYPGHTAERTFNIMERAGAFPPRPDVLQDQKVTFRFQSPIQKARKQLEIFEFNNSLNLIAPLAEAQPEVLDNLDGDEVVRDMPEWGSVPSRWIRPKKVVDQIRAGKAEQSMGQQELAAAGPISAAIKNVAQADAALGPGVLANLPA